MIRIVSIARRAALALVLAASFVQAAPIEVKVMTRNLYLGVDLAPVIAAILTPDDPSTPADDNNIPLAIGAAWQKVLDSKPVERLGRVADEILLHRPHVVGLQELVLWESRTPSVLVGGTGDLERTFDYERDLVAALDAKAAALGESSPYTLVTGITGFPVPGTGFGPALPPTDIVFTDGSGILVRNDVLFTAGSFLYSNIFVIPGLGLPVVRGVNWVDIQVEGHTVRVANTHLDSNHPGINLLQSEELADFLDTGPSRHIALGDFNSIAETLTGDFIPTGSDLNMRLNHGFSDAWLDKGTGPGFTWRDDELLSDPDPAAFFQRLDYVFHRGLGTDSIEIIGDDPACPAPCWPSDHAGLVVTLLVPEPGSLLLIVLGLVGAGFARRRLGV